MGPFGTRCRPLPSPRRRGGSATPRSAQRHATELGAWPVCQADLALACRGDDRLSRDTPTHSRMPIGSLATRGPAKPARRLPLLPRTRNLGNASVPDPFEGDARTKLAGQKQSVAKFWESVAQRPGSVRADWPHGGGTCGNPCGRPARTCRTLAGSGVVKSKGSARGHIGASRGLGEQASAPRIEALRRSSV
jgi:hypothetical protein